MHPEHALHPALNRRRGALGETIAGAVLELAGLGILARNLRCTGIEIDIVAREARCLVLVEVKLRQAGFQGAAQALAWPQSQRLRRAAEVLLARFDWADSVRLDVVGVTLRASGIDVEHLRGVA